MESTPAVPTTKNDRLSRILTLVIAISIPVSVALGAVGGLVADRFVWPWLQQFKFIANNNFFKSIDTIDGKTTIVRTEQKITVDENSGIIEAVEKVSPAVVSIVTTTNIHDFFGNVSAQKGGGTGFIITRDGLIMTNKHVLIDGENTKLKVLTSDGKSYDATVKATDPSNDLAVIKIEAKDLPVVSFGDSDVLKVGQRVVAIGNTLGQYQNTVTSGVISAKDRTITASGDGQASERLEGIMQTDAAISPGNSGGPLVNLSGEVIGINTAIDTRGQTIGFAIPINVAKPAITSVIEKGEIIRPMLGVRYIPITPEVAELNKLASNKGALILGAQGLPGILSGGPADKAGLKEGDIILKINNDELTENRGLISLIQKYKPDDQVEITYLRDGKQQSTKVTLDQAK